MSPRYSFFGRFGRLPVFQSIAIYLVSLAIFLALKLTATDSLIFWYVSGIGLLLYSSVNGIAGIFRQQWKKYAILSLICFIVLFGMMLLTATLLSGVGINHFSEFRQLFLALFIFQLMLTCLVAIYRLIAGHLQKI